jgi:sugar lactone lactonase YvrE
VGIKTHARGEPPLFVAEPMLGGSGFTHGIEGPACDKHGNVYAVNFERQQTIGKITPAGSASVFVTLPGNSTGNGLRFDKAGNLYVADYKGHNVLRVDMKSKTTAVFAHGADMNQPNDLAIGPDDTLYASDPNWKNGTGRVFMIDRQGGIQLAAENLGTVNGIEVSPDGHTLYVNESVQRSIWAFKIAADGSLSNKRLLKQFPDFGLDGMRCDVDGNLYVTRPEKGTVVKLSPAGEVLREIKVLGEKPTNITLCGRDGRTAYVTEAEQGRLVSFRIDRPGLEWKRWHR